MSKPTVLVTGGAGYIGSHVLLALIEKDFPVLVLDNLSTGHREAIPGECRFIEGNAGDRELLARIFADEAIEAVIHFAGSIIVEESVEKPIKYYENNTVVSLRLIQACVEAGVNNIIFSSTAAVYGDNATTPVTESSQLSPINPYGHSKAMTEQFLADTAKATALTYIALRYFNVAGADAQCRTGQRSRQSTHLLKVACETALGKRDKMTVFGSDYPTRDGTCVRDFIHVSDLARAHVCALEYLLENDESLVLNCGYGSGYSVREVLDALQEITGEKMNIIDGERRAGDAVELVADNSRLSSLLEWKPEHDDLATIISDALRWEEHFHSKS